ncbi:hypothetical protein [Bartonella alsatica]|uniref:Uncharacterized protein n=1 Tax=Bartonella alsatica IBS 382 TaxID=1094551 RepID=J0YLB0_9HYPH|nr:hypothetical protein [Bartonella alsatica]EJF75363.1 hypothetical protein MEC_00839 [Bartonella alsatica IBS 382]
MVQEPTEVAAVETTSEQIETSLDNQPPIHEQENVPEKAKRVKANRGCRLPANFEPDSAFAIAEGLPPERLKVEIAKFRDYWKANAGKNAIKRDWQAAWRYWIISSKDYQRGKNYGNHSQRQKSVGERISDSILDIGNRGRSSGLRMKIKRVQRDEKQIEQINKAVETFLAEIEQDMKQILTKAA